MFNWYIIGDEMKSGEPVEGSEEKFFIEIKGVKYLVKDSSYNKRRKQASLAPYCEYVGSNFIREIGIDCQETNLCFYMGRVVVVCKDLYKGTSFKPFRDLHQSSVDSLLENKEYTYNDVLYVMSKIFKLKDNLSSALVSFWKMFLCDVILGNRDRHEGNWGFIEKEGKYKFSPIFDNGSSLFPDVNLSDWKNKEFIKERVYRIPASQFKLWREEYSDRAMRTNYWEILNSSWLPEEFYEAFKYFVNIDIIGIMSKILWGLPKEYSEWYISIVYARYNCLILKREFDDVSKEVEDGLYGKNWLS